MCLKLHIFYLELGNARKGKQIPDHWAPLRQRGRKQHEEKRLVTLNSKHLRKNQLRLCPDNKTKAIW